MSVAVAVRKGGRIALATDTQTSFGASRVPLPNLKTSKIQEIGQSLLATTGWGLYENILDDLLSRRPETELEGRQSIFSFFLGFWKELHDQYPFVKDQCDKEDESPFGSLDASFLIVNPFGIFYVGTDMSVTLFEQYYAIGSGSDFALGALAVLYEREDDPQEICRKAVQAAITFDVHCGGEIPVKTVECARHG